MKSIDVNTFTYTAAGIATITTINKHGFDVDRKSKNYWCRTNSI